MAGRRVATGRAKLASPSRTPTPEEKMPEEPPKIVSRKSASRSKSPVKKSKSKSKTKSKSRSRSPAPIKSAKVTKAKTTKPRASKKDTTKEPRTSPKKGNIVMPKAPTKVKSFVKRLETQGYVVIAKSFARAETHAVMWASYVEKVEKYKSQDNQYVDKKTGQLMDPQINQAEFDNIFNVMSSAIVFAGLEVKAVYAPDVENFFAQHNNTTSANDYLTMLRLIADSKEGKARARIEKEKSDKRMEQSNMRKAAKAGAAENPSPAKTTPKKKAVGKKAAAKK